jgi:hypothetical protein
MSKFEELCRAYAVSRKNYFDYRDACLNFAKDLVWGMVDYFKCPREQVKFIPLKEDIKPNTIYGLLGAMHLDDDTFWHLGFGLTLYVSPNIFPQETALLRFLVKKVDDCFVVKLGIGGDEFRIHKDQLDELTTFYDYVFEQIEESYEKELQRFLEQEETSRKIGFNV